MGCYRREARRARRDTLDRVYRHFPILGERRRQLAGSLSGGQQQMVAIGRGAHGPAPPAAAGRALAGPGADDRRADVRDHPRHPRRGRGHPARRAERRRRRWTSPTAPTCWRRGGWWPTARRRSCGSNPTSSRRILASATKQTSTGKGRHEHGRDQGARSRVRAPAGAGPRRHGGVPHQLRHDPLGADAERALHARHRPPPSHPHHREGRSEVRGLRILRRQRGRPGPRGQGARRLRGGIDRRAGRRQARAAARAQRLSDRGRARHRHAAGHPGAGAGDEHRRRRRCGGPAS